MKICLKCNKEFEPKRDTAKFCSTSCRVMYGKKNQGRKKETVLERMEAINEEMKRTLLKIHGIMESSDGRTANPVSPETAIGLHNLENTDQFTATSTYSYEGLKALINASTSSHDLEHAWKIVKAATWLAGWQIRELTKLKELQQTKIDF